MRINAVTININPCVRFCRCPNNWVVSETFWRELSTYVNFYDSRYFHRYISLQVPLIVKLWFQAAATKVHANAKGLWTLEKNKLYQLFTAFTALSLLCRSLDPIRSAKSWTRSWVLCYSLICTLSSPICLSSWSISSVLAEIVEVASS